MKIIFIGSGNMATHLAINLKSAGHGVLQVYSRNLNNAKKLAKKLYCNFTDDLKKIKTDADIYLVCVKEDAIAKVVSGFGFRVSGSQIIAHTSGAMPINVYKQLSTVNYQPSNFGVFYPMQTFSKEKKLDLSNTAIFIEANNKSTEKKLVQLAQSISKNIHRMNSEQRKTVHLAAVFANNFTNHFYTIAEEILKKNKLSFEILKPLISETTKKIQNYSPLEMQTGPAKRGEKKIILEHLKMLNKFPGYRKIYDLVSKSIIKKYS